MNQWQRNHFKLLRLVEWREQSLSDSVERLLIRVGREYRKKDYAPSALELVQAMEPVMPFIRNLVASAGITGTAEAVIRANFDLKTPFREYFRHGSLPTRITLDKIWEYLEATGFERGPLFEQMQAHTRRMTDQIARLAEKKIHETLTEGMAQKWTLDRMKGQLTREFNGLKKQDVESVMPSVETVVRTESMTILHASQWESAQCTPALRSMLWGFEYFAVGDARTRPTHDAQDGVTAPATSDFWNHWYPPNGYNCRCSVIPLYDEPEPSERKEPRWDLNPDKGFDFNPGRSRPFNLGTPKAQEPEKPQQTESPKPSKPSRESDRISIPAEPLRVPELSKLDTPPLSQFSTLPKANPLESVTKKPESVAKPSEIVTKKPESVAKPSKKESGSPFRPMTQDEMVSVLLTVRSRFGVETAKRLTLVPSPGGCEVFWDGVFVGSVGFELDVSGLQLTLSPVRFFKIIFGKVKKTFYSLWSVVEWVVEQNIQKTPNTQVPKELLKRAGTNGHGEIYERFASRPGKRQVSTINQIEGIQRRTGLPKEKCAEIQQALMGYTDKRYSEINDTEDANPLIEEFLETSEVWGKQGCLYRGISISPMSQLQSVSNGEKICFSRYTSWSSNVEIAKKFARWDENCNSVIFIMLASYKACSIAELSSYLNEGEILMKKRNVVIVRKISVDFLGIFKKIIIEVEEVYDEKNSSTLP